MTYDFILKEAADVAIMTKTFGSPCKRIIALLVKDGPATTEIE